MSVVLQDRVRPPRSAETWDRAPLLKTVFYTLDISARFLAASAVGLGSVHYADRLLEGYWRRIFQSGNARLVAEGREHFDGRTAIVVSNHSSLLDIPALMGAVPGSLRMVLRTRGQEAHSAYPELGRSAVESMVALLADLRKLELPKDALLGETTMNVGTIRGGSAANVFAGECEVEAMIRLVGDAEEVKSAIAQLVGDRAVVEWGSHIQPQRFHTIPGFDTTTVAYTSDVPILSAWGTPLMFGPGSIHHAHTEEEHVSLEDLRSAVSTYERIVRAVVAS